MIDLLYAGWKAAQLWSKWNEKPPEMVSGSAEDIQELWEFTEAIYEDNQRLIEATQHQQKQIDLLRTQVGVAFVLIILMLAAIAWLALRH